MPEINQSDNLQGEIAMLEKMIAEKKAVLGREHTEPEAHEMIKETLREMYPVSTEATPPETPTVENSGPAPVATTTGATLPADYLDTLPDHVRAELDQYIALAFTKGINEAVSAAAASANNGDFFLVDALHDALATRLYEELKATGKI